MLKGTAFKVLLVQDNLAVAQQLQEWRLEAKGVRVPVTCVQGVSEALEALNQENFDVILLDFSLPESKWLDTITTLKEYPFQGNTYACPPIVVLSGIEDEELALQAIYAGAQDYLMKGKIESKRLMRSLRYAIARSAAPQAAIARRNAIPLADCSAVPEDGELGKNSPHPQSAQPVDDHIQDVSCQSALKQLEFALQQSEAQLQRLAENVPGVIYQYRHYPDGTDEFTYVSPGIRDLLELEPETVVQSTELMWASVHPDDLSAFVASVRHSTQTLEQWRMEWRSITPSGVVKWIKGVARPERQPDGTLVWDGILLDISDVYDELRLRKQAEEALKESNAKFRQMAQSIRECFWMSNAEMSQVIYVSPAYEEIWGRSCQSAYEQIDTWLEAVHPEDRPPIRHSWERLFQGETIENEYRVIRPDGSMVWVLDRSFPVRNEKGEIYRFAGIVLDISDRKRTQEALHQSAATNRALLNGIPDMIFRCRADGTFIDFKPAKDIKTFVPPSVFMGKKVQEVLPPPLAQRLMQACEQTLVSGKTQIVEYQLPSDDELHDYEARIVASDSDEMIAIVRDITERKRTESALRQQKELLQTIFDHLPVMVAFYDTKGQLQLVNRELERLLGWSLAELGNCDLLAFCYPNPKYRQRVVEHMLAAQGKWQDFKTRTRDNRVLDTSWANIRLSDGTRIGIGSDITERKRAEEALRTLTQQEHKRALQLEQTLTELQHAQAQLVQNEKMASLGQLVAGVAHEINNPVSFIYCNIDPALDYTSNLLRLISFYQQHYPTPSAEIQEAIAEIDLNFIKKDFPKLLKSMQEGASRIHGIVQSLRNFSRLDEAETKKADLHKGLDSTLMILQTRLRQQPNRAAIQVMKEYGELPLVKCYPGELNQVFMNILSNAIDALEERMMEDSSLTAQIRICTEVVRVTEKTAKIQKSTVSYSIQNPFGLLPCPEVNSGHQPPKSKIETSSTPCSDKVVIRIADNGTGISSKVQQRVFDPFFTSKPIGKGTGLGLSISHAIVVKKHQGELYCHSQYGQGTEFVIELPLR